MRRLLNTITNIGLFTSFALLTLTMQLSGSETAKGEEFQPIKEAEMPKGFPAYTPVGEIEVKKYPA